MKIALARTDVFYKMKIYNQGKMHLKVLPKKTMKNKLKDVCLFNKFYVMEHTQSMT